MNDGVLLVNFGSLQNASADIQKALNELQSQLDTLDREGNKLIGTWHGEARAAYYARQAKWTAASKDLSEILRNIKIAVDESASDYQNTERKATERFQ